MDYLKVKAILVTLIINLLLAVVVFTFRISEAVMEQNNLQLELEDVVATEQDKAEAIKEMQDERVERMADALIANQARSNMGVNTAEKLKEEISTEKFAEQFQKELEANRTQLPGWNNNQQANANTPQPEGKEEDAITPEAQDEKKKQAQEKEFKGLTNIYFNLAGRRSYYLPVPVYMCQGSGQVFLNIDVDQNGEVVSVTIDKAKSDADECLHQSAMDAARRSRFNPKYDAPAKQKGTLTYLFVAQ
jgi:TonB family protein